MEGAKVIEELKFKSNLDCMYKLKQQLDESFDKIQNIDQRISKNLANELVTEIVAFLENQIPHFQNLIKKYEEQNLRELQKKRIEIQQKKSDLQQKKAINDKQQEATKSNFKKQQIENANQNQTLNMETKPLKQDKDYDCRSQSLEFCDLFQISESSLEIPKKKVHQDKFTTKDLQKIQYVTQFLEYYPREERQHKQDFVGKFTLTDGKFKCNVCQRFFTTQPSFIIHYRKFHSRTALKCLNCSNYLGCMTDLFLHDFALHNQRHSILNQIVPCEFCGKEVKGRTSYKEHLTRTHIEILKPEIEEFKLKYNKIKQGRMIK